MTIVIYQIWPIWLTILRGYYRAHESGADVRRGFTIIKMIYLPKIEIDDFDWVFMGAAFYYCKVNSAGWTFVASSYPNIQ